MHDVIETIFSNQVLAILVPALIFLVTVVLIIRRLASFLITCALLIFALSSGFAIFHHDVVAEMLRGEMSEQQSAKIKQDFIDFRDEIIGSIRNLKEDLTEPPPSSYHWDETQSSIREIRARFEELEDRLVGQLQEPETD